MKGRTRKHNRLPWCIRFCHKVKKYIGKLKVFFFQPKILNMDMVTLRISDFDENLFSPISLFLQILGIQ